MNLIEALKKYTKVRRTLFRKDLYIGFDNFKELMLFAPNVRQSFDNNKEDMLADDWGEYVELKGVSICKDCYTADPRAGLIKALCNVPNHRYITLVPKEVK